MEKGNRKEQNCLILIKVLLGISANKHHWKLAICLKNSCVLIFTKKNYLKQLQLVHFLSGVIHFI